VRESLYTYVYVCVRRAAPRTGSSWTTPESKHAFIYQARLYMFVYVCVCVYVCLYVYVCMSAARGFTCPAFLTTNGSKRAFIHQASIYRYLCVCLCVCAYMYMSVCLRRAVSGARPFWQ